MKYPVFSVKDRSSDVFCQPYVDTNDKSALRGFSYRINNEPLMSFKPSDYELYHVGEFDTQTGYIDGQIPVLVCRGEDVYSS